MESAAATGTISREGNVGPLPQRKLRAPQWDSPLAILLVETRAAPCQAITAGEDLGVEATPSPTLPAEAVLPLPLPSSIPSLPPPAPTSPTTSRDFWNAVHPYHSCWGAALTGAIPARAVLLSGCHEHALRHTANTQSQWHACMHAPPATSPTGMGLPIPKSLRLLCLPLCGQDQAGSQAAFPHVLHGGLRVFSLSKKASPESPGKLLNEDQAGKGARNATALHLETNARCKPRLSAVDRQGAEAVL